MALRTNVEDDQLAESSAASERIFLKDRRKYLPVQAQVVKRALIQRSFDHHSNTAGRCQHPPNIMQKYGTCWFNSLCNLLCHSDRCRRLMLALYVDWVLGIRGSNDKKRSKVLHYFRLMVDLTHATPHVLETKNLFFRPLRPEAIIQKLHRYAPNTFRNVGRSNGYMPDRYFKRLLIFLGIPAEQILFLEGSKNVEEAENYWQMVNSILRKRKTLPMILLVHSSCEIYGNSEIVCPNGRLPVLKTPGKLEIKRPDGRTYKYMLDAKQLRSRCKGGSWTSCSGGHAIAGITCNGKSVIMDSNGSSKTLVNHDDGKNVRTMVIGRPGVKAYNWKDSIRSTTTATSPTQIEFRGLGAPFIAVYVCSEKLDAFARTSQSIATQYLRQPVEGDEESPSAGALPTRLRNYFTKQLKLALSIGAVGKSFDNSNGNGNSQYENSNYDISNGNSNGNSKYDNSQYDSNSNGNSNSNSDYDNSNGNSRIDTKVNAQVDSKVNSKVNAKVDPKVNSKVDPKVNAKVDPKVNGKVNTKVESKLYSQ